jgi:hypothetical protein
VSYRLQQCVCVCVCVCVKSAEAYLAMRYHVAVYGVQNGAIFAAIRHSVSEIQLFKFTYVRYDHLVGT